MTVTVTCPAMFRTAYGEILPCCGECDHDGMHMAIVDGFVYWWW